MALIIYGNICWSNEPVPGDNMEMSRATEIVGPKAISFQKNGQAYRASFHHQMTLQKGVTYLIPVVVASTEIDRLLQSLTITTNGKVTQSYSFRMAEEELAPRAEDYFPGVFNGDDFDIAQFRRTVLGKEVTIVAKRHGFSGEFVAQLDRSEPQKPTISATVDGPIQATISVTGRLLGLSGDPATFKLIVPAGNDQKIVEIAQDSILSIQLVGEIAHRLSQAGRLRELQTSHVKYLILNVTETLRSAEIDYTYNLPVTYEVDAVGELNGSPGQLSVTGWIKLRNSTPWNWQDVEVTIVSLAGGISNYALGKVTLEKAKIIRLPIPPLQPPQPDVHPERSNVLRTFDAELFVRVEAPMEGKNEKLPVRLQLNLLPPLDGIPVSLLADRLLIEIQNRPLYYFDSFQEVTVSSSVQSLILGSSKAIEVNAQRTSRVPILAQAISPTSGYHVICRGGRATRYTLTYNPRDPDRELPILLARNDTQAHEVVQDANEYDVLLNAVKLKHNPPDLELLELHKPEEKLLVPLAEVRNDFKVGGLQRLAQTAASAGLRETLSEAVLIRSGIDELQGQLGILEGQIVTLQERRGLYLREPQSKNHSVLIRQLDDQIYMKQMQIYDKRTETAIWERKLDQLAQKSLSAR